MNDDIDDLLAGRTSIPSSDGLRQTVLGKTRRVVRRRRIVRRVSFVALLLGVYGAGALTMRWVQTQETTDIPIAKNESAAPMPEPDAGAASQITPLAMEWQAIDNTEARAALFRQAGDRYLAELGDVESALRCYRNALDFSSTADAKIRPDDSWLMISLKQAKLKEKHDESLDS